MLFAQNIGFGDAPFAQQTAFNNRFGGRVVADSACTDDFGSQSLLPQLEGMARAGTQKWGRYTTLAHAGTKNQDGVGFAGALDASPAFEPNAQP